MNEPDQKPPLAWQPFTPRGVAAFGRAPAGRMLVVQLVLALVIAGVVVWFLRGDWYPVVTRAVNALPEEGAIRNGRLDWAGAPAAILGEDRYLAVVVDLYHSGTARSPAHVQVELSREGFRVYSLFGFVQGRYPVDREVAFNRVALVPWWGAWAPPSLAVVALGVVAGLMMTWCCLATLYLVPVWLIGFFGDRECTLGRSWRLAGAALMPGAALMTAGLVGYGVGALDVIHLVLVGALHVVVPWFYLAASPWCLPRQARAQVKENPFA